MIQLGRQAPKESVKNAIKIVKSHFLHFTKKQYARIMQSLKLDDQKMKEAVDEIIHLNPKPGNIDEDISINQFQITPDFLLEYNEGQLNLVLNSRNAPDLKLSKGYIEMMKDYASVSRTKEAAGFLKQKMDAAKGFIEAVRQRQTTMLNTMTAIMAYQKSYFEDGDETKLRPMILKDIADMTGYDISTISRVVNNKFIQTHFGIISLKSLFSEGMRTENGEEVSNREIKNILTRCIEQEDKQNPITDEQLMEILNQKGYQIARRTVAKYRETLGIPIARLRRTL
jgi:RNA polymerase sigma-54 factor